MKFNYKHPMTVAAHCGDNYNFYENTMRAFRSAIACGADMIETDMRLTKDNVMVLIHDATLDRTAGRSGAIRDMTYDELREVNVGDINTFDAIPTLKELFELIRDEDIMLNLEFKEYYSEDNRERCEYCIDSAIKMAEEYGITDRMVFNSFDAYVLEYIYKNYGKKYRLHGFYPYSAMLNVTGDPDEYLYCACIFEDKNKAHYDYLIAHNIEPWVGAGVRSQQFLKACADLGAVLVTTNHPADAIEKLSKEGLR